ncbi:spore germination protein GerW family protein [Cellulomonas sp. NS3]|uniref:spore germination protein GerW family protein n=1 Tax=Cellulomonas sp. NS3 TaxID=2973977 RepID=UPI002163240D|nr:spore germination protein GerW family protein [Cellulomonas sp. NS3]
MSATPHPERPEQAVDPEPTHARTRFDPAALTRAAGDTWTVRRVFGDAYERGGTTVIPVARVHGAVMTGSGTGEVGAGGGTSSGEGGGSGGGGGYATRVRAVGVYVVDDDGVHWRPALDLNRVILGGQLVGAVVLSAFSLAWALRRRR